MESKNEVIIYLNAEDDMVYVKVPPGIQTHFQIQNLAGKILQEDTHAKALHDFDITGYEDGNYFVIIDQNGTIKSKKITKGYYQI